MKLKIWLFTLILLFLNDCAQSAIYNWTGVENSTWSNANNWSPSGIPDDFSDTAIIDINAAIQPVIWAPVSVYSIYIATSGVYGSTLTANYPITASSMVVVGSKGVITHSNNTSAELYKSSITVPEMLPPLKVMVSTVTTELASRVINLVP